MREYALLLRLNPRVWPIWKEKITKEADCRVWFKTGRRRPDTIRSGIPVVVLGTKGLGVVAFGTTSSDVQLRSDPDWREVDPGFRDEYKEEKNRVEVTVKRSHIPLAKLLADSVIARLHHRRETVTWLDQCQYTKVVELLQQEWITGNVG